MDKQINTITITPVENGYLVDFSYKDYAQPNVSMVSYTIEGVLMYIQAACTPTVPARNTGDKN